MSSAWVNVSYLLPGVRYMYMPHKHLATNGKVQWYVIPLNSMWLWIDFRTSVYGFWIKKFYEIATVIGNTWPRQTYHYFVKETMWTSECY